MPSTTWTALRDQYITPLSLQPTVENQFIAPLSRAYEGPNQLQITFAGLSATLSNLESGAILDIENKLGLRSLLIAAEPRVRFNEALSAFEREKAVAQTAITTMGFNDIKAKWFSTRLDYVDQKIRDVVSDSLILPPESALLSAAGPRGVLMFLQHGIRDDSSQSFPNPVAGTSFNEVQTSFLYGVAGSINRICDAAEVLYEKEHEAELASCYVPPELLAAARRE